MPPLATIAFSGVWCGDGSSVRRTALGRRARSSPGRASSEGSVGASGLCSSDHQAHERPQQECRRRPERAWPPSRPIRRLHRSPRSRRRWKPVDGDAIYNGAVDNASGVAAMLCIAEAFTRLPDPALPLDRVPGHDRRGARTLRRRLLRPARADSAESDRGSLEHRRRHPDGPSLARRQRDGRQQLDSGRGGASSGKATGLEVHAERPAAARQRPLPVRRGGHSGALDDRGPEDRPRRPGRRQAANGSGWRRGSTRRRTT